MATTDETVQNVARPPPMKAPAESATAIITRRSIVFAFWGVVVLLGLPHWLWTTSIHRAELPLESMNAWAGGTAYQLRYPINVALRSSDLDARELADISHRVESALGLVFDNGLLTFNIHSAPQSDALNALTVNLKAGQSGDASNFALDPWSTMLNLSFDHHSADRLGDVADSLIDVVSSLYHDEMTTLSYLLRDGPYSSHSEARLSDEQIVTVEKRITRAFKYAPAYHLTFSLFTPGASPTTWEIEDALDQFISPLVSLLRSTSEFTIDTQVQLYASLSPSISKPKYDPVDNLWKLQYEDLSSFINAAEWPLSPSIGPGPTINFVLYVPAPANSPLVINGTGSTNWIIPQWGGVHIHNQSTPVSPGLSLQDLEQDMLVFADQLASLVGLPPTPASLALRLSSLTRQRATSAILSASSTLGALSRLTLKLTSIAIPDSVAQSVDETILRLERACSHLREGRFQLALEDARIAEAEAEKAFFEPSMVGQVYFPEEHKVAVYVPLLGPIAVPMLMALIKEIKALKASKVKAS